MKIFVLLCSNIVPTITDLSPLAKLIRKMN